MDIIATLDELEQAYLDWREAIRREDAEEATRHWVRHKKLEDDLVDYCLEHGLRF